MDGKVIVLTGAANGIGHHVAETLRAQGATLVLADVAFEDERRTDVTVEADVEQLAARAVANHGRIDVWINNAGIIRPAMLHKMPAEDFDAVLAVHVRGSFLGMRAAARQMRGQNQGSIINVTSVAGLDGTIGQINYAAAKGAIVAMTKSGARELGRNNVRVNAVAPLAPTEMTRTIREDPKFAETYLGRIPLGRWGDMDEIAKPFAFLASDASSYVTGQVLVVDGGMHMAS